jgi:hypothetical protein
MSQHTLLQAIISIVLGIHRSYLESVLENHNFLTVSHQVTYLTQLRHSHSHVSNTFKYHVSHDICH